MLFLELKLCLAFQLGNGYLSYNDWIRICCIILKCINFECILWFAVGQCLGKVAHAKGKEEFLKSKNIGKFGSSYLIFEFTGLNDR